MSDHREFLEAVREFMAAVDDCDVAATRRFNANQILAEFLGENPAKRPRIPFVLDGILIDHATSEEDDDCGDDVLQIRGKIEIIDRPTSDDPASIDNAGLIL